VQHDALGNDPKRRGEQGAVGRANVVGVDDALGQAGGAARVHDVEDVVAADTCVGRLVLRGVGDQRIERPEPGASLHPPTSTNLLSGHLRKIIADSMKV
jgi:hypothetical protein